MRKLAHVPAGSEPWSLPRPRREARSPRRSRRRGRRGSRRFEAAEQDRGAVPETRRHATTARTARHTSPRRGRRRSLRRLRDVVGGDVDVVERLKITAARGARSDDRPTCLDLQVVDALHVCSAELREGAHADQTPRRRGPRAARRGSPRRRRRRGCGACARPRHRPALPVFTPRGRRAIRVPGAISARRVGARARLGRRAARGPAGRPPC